MQIRGFDLGEKIYESPNSVIYEATQTHDGRSVILKIFNNQYPDPAEIACFKREYDILQMLDVPGVVEPVDYLEHRNMYIIVMENIGGESISRVMEKLNTKLSIREFLNLSIKICEVVAGIHRCNVIHKDINPSNIIWNRDRGLVKVIDLGISSFLEKEQPELADHSVLKGTLAYISPEQTGRMNRTVDYRTDIYSLGISLYEILAGHPPFEATDAMGYLHSHIAKTPPSPSEIDLQVPTQISSIVMKAIEKMAEHRYQSALGMKRDLEECQKRLRADGTISSFALARFDTADCFQIPEKLYGREEDLEQLLSAFQALHKGTPQLVLVTGYSGIGKSSLVNEIHKPIVMRRGYFATGKFDQLNRSIPYSSILHGFAQLIQELLTESQEQIERWRRRFQEHLGENARVITDMFPELELIIGPQPVLPDLLPTEAQNRFNLVFQQFIQTLASAHHPLVLFLDDIQWADAASLDLLKAMMSNNDNGHFMVIGAYRDNEVDSTHPVTMTINEIRTAKSNVREIHLKPLSETHIHQLLMDTLHGEAKDTEALARLCAEKTRGNPFFLTQFLTSLHEDELIIFDLTSGRWHADLPGIRNTRITDNVVDLMTTKIHRFAPEAQDILKIAACIGTSFDLSTVSVVSGHARTAAAKIIDSLLVEGVLVPIGDAYKYVHDKSDRKVKYRFLHDRVQQAAYSLIDPADKTRFHLKIGRLLLAQASAEEQEERLFEMVNHINMGLGLVTDENEKIRFASLGLRAGKKAKASAAYRASFDYLRQALRNQGPDWWEEHYELTFSLHTQFAESAYLCGRLDLMADHVAQVRAKARNLLDEVVVLEIEILGNMTSGKPLEGIDIGLDTLRLLGLNIKRKPSVLDVLVRLISAKMALMGKTPENLILLPEATDPKAIAAKRILTTLGSPAYLANKELYVCVVLSALELSLKKGNDALSAGPYSAYGVLLCSVLGDIELGYRYGQLALSILDKFDGKRFKGMLQFITNTFIFHWKDPIGDTLPKFQRSYGLALEAGDYVFAGHSAANFCYHGLHAAKPLGELSTDMRNYAKKMEEFNHLASSTNTLLIFHQTVENLRGNNSDPMTLTGEIYNAEQMLPVHMEQGDRINVWDVYSNSLMLCYLFEDYPGALAWAEKTVPYLDVTLGLYCLVIYVFYDSLTRLALAAVADPARRKALVKKVAVNQKKLRVWATHCPHNHLHKFQLVEAELARVNGKRLLAEDLYDKAIAGARENGFLQEQALACELSGRHHLQREKETIARVYLSDALQCYKRWGARAKVEKIQSTFAPLLVSMHPQTFRDPLTQTLGRTLPGIKRHTLTSVGEQVMDFDSMAKAAMTISEEMDLEKLLDRLLQILIENAGAQRGFLILHQEEDLVIRAQISVEKDRGSRKKIVSSPVLQFADSLSLSAVQYVNRTGQSLVLDDAAREERLAKDPYILRHQPKSLLCIPIVRHKQVTGLIYMENNQATGAFAQDRVKLITMLASQAAISIDNARLYNTVKDSAVQLEHALAEAKKSARVKGEFLARTSHELLTPLNAIINYPQIILENVQTTDVAVCSSCSGIFAMEKQDRLDDVTPCPACEKTGTLTREEYCEYDGDLSQMRTWMRSVADSGLALNKIVQNILDVSQLESGADAHHQAKLNLGQVIGKVISEDIEDAKLGRSAVERGPNLDKIVLFADRKKLEKIVYNLLGNAIKFSSPQQAVEIAADIKGDFVTLCVRDRGIGIDEANLEYIFDAFFQVDSGSTREFGGTGLGLTVTKQLVEDHQGNIWATSQLGEGSTFFVELPLGGLRGLEE